MDKNTEQTLKMLGNTAVPLEHRASQLVDLMAGAQNGESEYTEIVNEVFKRLNTKEVVEDEIREKAETLDKIMSQIESAPLRPATFIQMSKVDGTELPHALISMESGELAYVVIKDQLQARKLSLGDKVMLDAKGKILMHKALNGLYCGLEGKFDRKIDDRHIEVTMANDSKAVVIVHPDMIKQIDSGEVVPGASIVIGSGGRLGLKALPSPDKNQHYRFLEHGAIPDIQVDRDIGNPPKIIGEVALHVREEMTRPELRRKFRLRPCITRLLCGVSGTGKSLAIGAIHRQMYEIMAEITDTPIGELPPRVFRMRSSQMLSMWFGESDKNIDRMFDEVENLADKRYTNKKGKEFSLPVMVVLEEADGLGRARGQDNIYDRIMTVILQRLDPNREGLATKLVVFLSTTNEPHIVDPAFLRRIGGSVEVFGRLDKNGFSQILTKQISGLPVKETKSKKIVDVVSSTLFESDRDKGVVELTFQGYNEPVVKYRRDFLTGALIDRAVQQASASAWEESIHDVPDSGINAVGLWQSLNSQVLSVVHQLHPENVHNYTDLPDGVRVTRVRRIPQDKEAIFA